jgi:hypothetical protein
MEDDEFSRRRYRNILLWCTFNSISRVLFEKLLVCHMAKKSLSFVNSEVQYRVLKSPPPFPVLNQVNQVQIISFSFSKIHFSIIHSATPRSCEWSRPFRCFYCGFIRTSHCCMPVPFHNYFLYIYIYIYDEEWNSNNLFMHVSPELLLLPLGPNILYRTLFSNPLNPFFA